MMLSMMFLIIIINGHWQMKDLNEHFATHEECVDTGKAVIMGMQQAYPKERFFIACLPTQEAVEQDQQGGGLLPDPRSGL